MEQASVTPRPLALDAIVCRSRWNDTFFFSAPQLKRDPLGSSERMNGIITVFVITLRFAWPALCLLLALTSLGLLAAAGRPFPPMRAFLYLFVPFLVIGVWAGANWANVSAWRSIVLDVLGVLSLVFAVVMPWAFRKVPRWWVLIPASIIGFLLSLAAWFVGGMAISNSWL